MSESARAIPPFVDAPAPYAGRRSARPTAREWGKHTVLFLLTLMTATLAGIMLVSNGLADPIIADPVSWLDYLLYVPEFLLMATVGYLQYGLTHPSVLAQGATFALSLLAILTAHEAGHYIACRRYGVQATLPFFIPAPPIFLAGTFGAFIKIKSPIPSRRALFDIGVAGPIAGFVVAVPIAVVGLLTAQAAAAPLAPGAGQGGIIFSDSLLLQLLSRALGAGLNIEINPFYFASWIGLLVTSLNLMPVGQLDGGHATYALFGVRAHKWIGRAAFAVMSVLAVLGWVWNSSPSGFLYAVLLGVMLRVRHPHVEDEREPLGRSRLVVAILTLVIFALSFLPFPIKVV
ncbi:MAG TPA: site-2 protease family protein [Pyrinomonadaceae bacterium]|jgi:membrane-associated protease RseP (regulator of RpoE activity)